MVVGIGALLLALGFAALVWGVFQRVKASRVAGAPLVGTGEASRGTGAGPKGQISAQGRVSCAQPLVSPVTGTPCLYYRVKAEARWKSGNETKTKILDDQKVAAAFAIDDGSGPVAVDAREGGDFEAKTHEEEKGTGLLGGITGQALMFGSYRVETGVLALGTKFIVTEEVLPLAERLYACGVAQGGAIASPRWRSLILSPKTRDELLASATKSAKISLIGGGAAFAAGVLVAVLGAVFAPAAAKPVVAAAASSPSPVVSTAAPAVAPSAIPSAPAPLATTAAAFAAKVVGAERRSLEDRAVELTGTVKSIDSDADGTLIEFDVPLVKGKLAGLFANLPPKTAVKKGQTLAVRGTVVIDDAKGLVVLVPAQLVPVDMKTPLTTRKDEPRRVGGAPPAR